MREARETDRKREREDDVILSERGMKKKVDMECKSEKKALH